MRSAKSGSEATKLEEWGSDSVRTPFLHFMNTGIIRSEIYWGGGVLPGGTFRFKKIDGSFWNGETFRFADYSWQSGSMPSQLEKTQMPSSCIPDTREKPL